MKDKIRAEDVQTGRIERQYDAFARVYDRLWAFYTHATLDAFETWIHRSTAAGGFSLGGADVLDVACGTGALMERLLARTPSPRSVAGVDLSRQMLQQTRRKIGPDGRTAFEQADAGALPFPDGTFDAAVCVNSFHYFPRPAKALREMRRVLRPGGRLFLMDWCRDYWTCRAMDAVLTRIDPAHGACHTQTGLHAMARGADLDLRAHERFRVQWIWGQMALTAARTKARR